MFYLCFYIWMNANIEREAGGGRGHEYRCFLCGEVIGGAERRLPFRCPSCVQPSQWGRGDNAGDSWWQRQLVFPLAATCEVTCRPHKEEREVRGRKKSPYLTYKQQEGPAPDSRPVPRWSLSAMSDNVGSVRAARNSSVLLLALTWVITTNIRGTGGCRLNQVTFPFFHFFHPEFEYERESLSLLPSQRPSL